MASKIIEYDTTQDKISKVHLVLPFFLTAQTVLEMNFFFLMTIFSPFCFIMFLVSKVLSSFYPSSYKVLTVYTMTTFNITKSVSLAIMILYYSFSWDQSL